MDDTNKTANDNQVDAGITSSDGMQDGGESRKGNEGSDQAADVSEARENLKAALQVGLTVQMISVVVTFAIKKGKEDFLKKLNDLVLELHSGLTDDEKKELQEDTNIMMDQKAEELVESLGEQLSPEELETVVKEIKDLAQSETNA